MKQLDLQGSYLTPSFINAMDIHGCFVLLHPGYKSDLDILQVSVRMPLIFDNRAEKDRILIKDAISGDIHGEIFNMSLPYALSHMAEA